MIHLSNIDPGALYPIAVVSRLFSVVPKTINNWIDAGKLMIVRIGCTRRVFGRELLRLAGLTEAVESETATQRRRRVKDAAELLASL